MVEGPRDYFTLISTADLTAGQAASAKCKQCHTFEAGGAVVTGPPLYGVVGRDIASQDFKYSTGPGSLSNMDALWDYEKLDHFIEAPKRMIPGTAMGFAGIKSQKERANLIAWLRTLTAGEPLPLPPPLPPQPAAPAEGATPTDASAPSQGALAPATPGQPAPATPAPARPAQPAPH